MNLHSKFYILFVHNRKNNKKSDIRINIRINPQSNAAAAGRPAAVTFTGQGPPAGSNARTERVRFIKLVKDLLLLL